MARQERQLTPGYTLVYPNRNKASAKLAKLLVVVLLLLSVAVMLLVTIGGWSKLQGMKPINFAWCLIYLIIAAFVLRWARGLLPIAAAMAMVLLILAAIAASGYAGTSWFDRTNQGFGHAQTLFGGSGLGANTIGIVIWLIVPLQALLIAVGMFAFSQGWNVEQEVPIDEARRRRGIPPASASPAAA